MKKTKFLFCSLLLSLSNAAFSQSTYAPSHGSLIAGESNSVLNGGAKIFFPVSVGGNLVQSASGSFVKLHDAKAGSVVAGLSVRSGLQEAPRNNNTWIYTDASGNTFLSSYDTYAADVSFTTSVNQKPVLLEDAKYPGLKTASKVFSTYMSSTSNSTYYYSGSNLYRTDALKKGFANSSSASQVNSNVTNVIGVDAGVFAKTASGVSFHGADGSSVGLSSIINGNLTDDEFKSIVAVHNNYYVMVMESGSHLIFKADGSFSKEVSGFDRAGIVSYYSRTAQADGHNGQTTFAWFDADYSLNYIDPYASEANAIKNINWSLIGGSKLPRTLIVKVLSVSEDGFVQYTGKNSINTSAYFHVVASFDKLATLASVTSSTVSEASASSASSIAWNNPSNPLWHYKVPPATFGNSGAKTYYWKWSTHLASGKILLSRTSGTVQVQEYGGGGRFCKLPSSYVAVSSMSNLTGIGSNPVTGPSNTCGGSTLTSSQMEAASGINGLKIHGSLDYSYIDNSGTFTKNASYKDLSSFGAPSTFMGALRTPGTFTGVSAWDGKHSMLFALSNNGSAFISGEIFSPGVGSSELVPIPLSSPFIANTTGEVALSSATLSWNDPRDPRVGATSWSVTTSRQKNGTPTDVMTLDGNVGSRLVSWNSETDGSEQTFNAKASIIVPVIGHRGASIEVIADDFQGSVAKAPQIILEQSYSVASNSQENELLINISDVDVGDILTSSITAEALHGTVTILNGKFYYKPNLNYSGSDSFSIKVQDKYGLSSSSVVPLSVVCTVPSLTGFALTKKVNGPYRGTDANLSYSADACNGNVTAIFEVKDSLGATIASQSGTHLLEFGNLKSKAFNFTDLAPGFYSVSVNVKSAVNSSFDSTLTASGGYKSDPVAQARIVLSKDPISEDDQVTATIVDLDNCILYNSVADAKLNKGCFIEWGKSTGIHTLQSANGSSAQFGSFRGAQDISATVKAYNVDGTNHVMPPVSLNFNVTKSIDVNLDLTFSKAGNYKKLSDKFAVTLTGNAANQCSVSATNEDAVLIANGGSNSCVVEFTSMPTGISQLPGVLQLEGRVVDLIANQVNYSVYRVISAESRFLVNSGSFEIPVIDSTFSGSISVSPLDYSGNAGYKAKLSVAGSTPSLPATSVNDAKLSWLESGSPRYLIDWSSKPTGISSSYVDGENVLSGVPSSIGDQSSSYRAFFIDQNETQYQITTGNSVYEHAPVITNPNNTANFESGVGFMDLIGILVSDQDFGDTYTYSIVNQGLYGVARVDNGKLQYMPNLGASGSDKIKIKATDKFGAFNITDMNIDVSCPMPNRGSAGLVPGSTLLNARPVSFTATYSPKNTCNFGFLTKFEISNLETGEIVKSITQPSSDVVGVNYLGEEESLLYFNDQSFGVGSYGTKFVVSSNAYPDNVFEIPGLTFVIKGFTAPILTLNKSAPDENDVVTVSIGHESCTSFATSVTEARTLPNSCYVEWSKTGFVKTIARATSSTATLTGDRGFGTIIATLKVADAEGLMQTVSSGSVSLNFKAGVSEPVLTPIFSKTSYITIRDYVVGGISLGSGGLQCTIVRNIAEGIAVSSQGGKACKVEFTKLPSGFLNSALGVGFEGRFVNDQDKTFEYSVSRVFEDGSVFELPGGSFDAVVSPLAVEVSVQTSKPAFVAGAEDALISLRISNAGDLSTACYQTGLVSEASLSWDGPGVPRCLVSWTSTPAGMQADGNLGLTLVGKPTIPTSNTVGYKVEFVDNLGTKYLILSGNKTISIIESNSPVFTFVGKNGYFSQNGSPDRYYLVSEDGLIGTGTFTGASFAPMTVNLLDGLTDTYTTSDNNVTSGNTVNLVVSTNPGNAWASRNSTMVVGYAGHGNLLTNVTTIGLIRMPPSSLMIKVSAPSTSLDTSDVQISIQLGELDGSTVTYNSAKHGMWNAYLAEKSGSTYIPLTSELAISSNDGKVTFDGINGGSLNGKTIYAVAVPYLAGGSLIDSTYKVVSSGDVINFIPGGAIPATLSASRTSGAIPFGVRFDLAIDSQFRDDVKSISYEYSVNSGGWILMAGLKTYTGTYTFQEGGIYRVRAIITNKNSLAISETSPVELFVKQALKMTVTNSSMALPGTDVEFTMSATKPDGTTVSYVNEWEIYRQNEAVQTINNVNSINLTSTKAQVVNVKIKARPTELPADDPASWVVETRTMVFATPDKPRAAITGPSTIEAGVVQEFSVKIVPSWPTGTNTTMQLSGKWILPNGNEIPGTGNLSWSPTPEEIISGGQLLKLKYSAWVIGAEADSVVTVSKNVYVKKYEFPHFKLVTKADTTYAPSFINVAVQPETSADTKLMLGKKFSFAWTIPEGVVGKATGSKFAGILDMPGVYEISVVATDERGSEQILTHTFEIVESRPYAMTLKTTLADKFNRPPAMYALKIDVLGGHPKDRIKSFKTYVNDVMVIDSGIRKPSFVSINQSGDSTIKVTMESTLGALVEASQSLTVGENLLPTCELTETWESKGKYVGVKSVCKDLDGVIKKYTWYIDDVLQTKVTTTRIFWTPTDVKTSAILKLVVTDSSGATGETSLTLTKP